MTPGCARIGASSPIDETTAVLRIACNTHATQAKEQGWVVKPYDGPMECYFCARNRRATLEPLKS